MSGALSFESMKLLPRVLVVAVLASLAGSARAQMSDPGSLSPRVPVSAFARPAAWLDPSRLQISTELSFGTGFGGGPAQGLQVTRFQYRVGEPLALSVSLGNAFGAPGARGSSPFLEGLDLAYRPFNSFLIQVRYQDFRSPLQYSRGDLPYAWR
jgi:hypothetical protein